MAQWEKTLEQRFWEKVYKTKTCWLWKKSICTSTGYGQLGSNQTKYCGSAHRISWELHYGKIPKGLCVCHRCDIRHCVRPTHLFLGTRAENVLDARSKNRHWHKLTKKQVAHIRRLAQYDFISRREISRRFRISHTMVNDIVHRVWWK